MKIDEKIKQLSSGFDLALDFIRDHREELDGFADDQVMVLCGLSKPNIYITCEPNKRDEAQAFCRKQAVESGWNWMREDKGWQVEYKCETPGGFHIVIEQIEDVKKNQNLRISPLVFA